ncbi:MAG: flagellin FliC [Cupriavidus sp.]|nr:MAG: flagellin FliC [Cupriavidus sp.]
MSLTINTNINSLVAQNNLNMSQSSLTSAIAQLSSGLRINSAADDAAGYAIGQRMNGQINGLNMASNNVNSGVSLVQTALGSLTSITNNIQSLMSLAVEAANGTNSTGDLTNLNTQAGALQAEIDRVAGNAQFNGVNLLDGTFTGKVLQVGANTSDTLTLSSIAKMDTTTLGIKAGTVDLSTTTKANASIALLQTALDTVNTAAAGLGATQNQLQSISSYLATYSQNLQSAHSTLTDANFAQATAQMTKANILQQAGVSVLAQANSAPQSVLKLLQ